MLDLRIGSSFVLVYNLTVLNRNLNGAEDECLLEKLTQRFRDPILITGGAGFLGVTLIRQLRRCGHRVVVVDNGSGGTGNRIRELQADSAIRVYRADVCDAPALTEICGAEQPWAVVHLAARHFLPYCEAHPNETWSINVAGTHNLVTALAPNPPIVFIFASTADVYRESVLPHGEADALGSATAYGQSKLAAERIVQEAAKDWGSKSLILRLFNLYGPNDTVDHFIPTIISQAFGQERLTLGDVSTIRDYVYVDDASAAIVELLAQRVEGIYNVGTEIGTSGQELIALVRGFLNRDCRIVTDLRRLRNVRRAVLVADSSRLCRVLPWWPATLLDVGLGHAIDAFRQCAIHVRAPRTGRSD